MTYSAIGDCYSYRAGQMPSLLAIERYRNIPVMNLVRHPLVWLEHHVRWRASNMRMREGAVDPLVWEWKVTTHGYFEYLGLKSYEKEDINIWTSYQGMFMLNNILGDVRVIDQHYPIEKIADDPELFKDLINYLSRGKVNYDQVTLDKAYGMCDTLFRGESALETNPVLLFESWPGWKVDAFRKLVSREAVDVYIKFGYDMDEILCKPINVTPVHEKVRRSIFISSLPKSGTWLIREIIEMVTGLKAYEPDIVNNLPEYENEMLIDFPPGTFFSWHSILTSRTVSLLNGCQSKNIFLIRNIYDVLLSMYNHLIRDVDASIGRSAGGTEYFSDKKMEQCLTLMISGFTSPRMSWMGAGPILKQMDSLLAYVESGEALLLDYDELTNEKRNAIKSISKFLEIRLPRKRINEILTHTEKNTMRERLRESGRDLHVTADKHTLSRDVFSLYHKEMLDRIVMTETPQLPERLNRLGLDTVLYLEEPEEVTHWARFKRTMKKRNLRKY